MASNIDISNPPTSHAINSSTSNIQKIREMKGNKHRVSHPDYVPKPAMRQEAATTGSWMTNTLSFAMIAIFSFSHSPLALAASPMRIRMTKDSECRVWIRIRIPIRKRKLKKKIRIRFK